MIRRSQIQVHMEVCDSAGHPLARVEHLERDNRIRLSRRDPKGGRQRYIPVEWVAAVQGGRLWLDRSAAEAEQAWAPSL